MLRLLTRTPPWLAALLGLFVLLPTVGMGFYVDDHVHQLVLDGTLDQGPMRPWALYDFGTRGDWQGAGPDTGAFPWWTGPEWKTRFLRPVSSVYLWGAHAIFGAWAPGYHLLGLALFAWLVVLLHGLFRRLGMSPAAANAGAAVFALADCSVLPVGWPANVNTLLAALLSVLALRAVVAGEGSEPLSSGRIARGLLCAVCAALAKESGVVVLLFVGGVLAFQARRAPGRGRLFLAAGIAFLLVAVHATVYVQAGYGTHSAFYATPWSDPARFSRNLVLLATGGLASLFGPFPFDAAALFPPVAWVIAGVGALLAWPFALWIGRSLRGHPLALPLALWTAATLAFQAGAPSADRLLFLPTLGVAGLLGLFLERRLMSASSRGGTPSTDARLPRLATHALVLSLTVGSGAYALLQSAGMRQSSSYLRSTTLATDVGSPELGHRDLLVLQTESQVHAFTLGSTWAYGSEDRDLAFWIFQMGPRPLRWTRTADRAFELETLGEPFLSQPFELPYLSGPADVPVGTRWRTTLFEVEALAVDPRGPTRLAFTFQRSLDDAALRFLRPARGRLVEVAPPAVGASIELPAPVRVGPFMP